MRAWYFIQVDMQLHISTNKYLYSDWYCHTNNSMHFCNLSGTWIKSFFKKPTTKGIVIFGIHVYTCILSFDRHYYIINV